MQQAFAICGISLALKAEELKMKSYNIKPDLFLPPPIPSLKF